MLSEDGLDRAEKVPQSISAGTSPRTQLGKLTVLPRLLADEEGIR